MCIVSVQTQGYHYWCVIEFPFSEVYFTFLYLVVKKNESYIDVMGSCIAHDLNIIISDIRLPSNTYH